MTAGHHRADRPIGHRSVADSQAQPNIRAENAPPSRPVPETKAAPKARSKPKPQPKPKRVQAPVKATRPVPQPQPTPAAPPVRTSQWMPAESVPRSVYSSSMLEMLGLDEDTVFEPTVTTMTSPEPTWQALAPVAIVDKLGLDRLPTLSDMQMTNDSRTDTGTLIERLWFATEEHEAVQPAASLQRPDFSEVPDRTFRWSVIIAAVVALTIAVALLQIGIRIPTRIAADATATYRSDVADAQELLPTARSVTLSITDPAVTVEGLSDAAVTLSQLDTAARNLFTDASEPLSSTPPLISRAALDALTPVRSDMARASQDGLAIERRLGDALTYRLVFGKAFALPELPVTVSPGEISALGVELGLGLAATLDAIAALPNDPAFEAHRAQAEVLAGRYAEWQIEYLSALRTGDLNMAAVLVEELQVAVERLTTGIAFPLQTVAAWTSGEIDRYDTTLARLAGSLG